MITVKFLTPNNQTVELSFPSHLSKDIKKMVDHLPQAGCVIFEANFPSGYDYKPQDLWHEHTCLSCGEDGMVSSSFPPFFPAGKGMGNENNSSIPTKTTKSSCEECGGRGFTIGFFNEKKKDPCEACSNS